MDFYGEDSDDSDQPSYLLHNAAEVGDLELLKNLLAPSQAAAVEPTLENLLTAQPFRKKSVNINERDDDSCTPLHIALLSGHLPVVSALLEAGASVTKACEGSPPLHVAVCTGGQPGMADFADAAAALLIKHGAVPYDRDDHGRTPLHWAASLGLPGVVATLVQAAERVRAEMEAALAAGGAGEGDRAPQGSQEEAMPRLWVMQDKQGNTALHLAARHCQPGAVTALLVWAAGGETGDGGTGEGGSRLVKVRNKAGRTALHSAALGGCRASAAALRAAAPACSTTKDKQGLTPAELAVRRGYAELATELAGAAPSAVESVPQRVDQRTVILAPPESLAHLTCPEPMVRGGADPPPENVNRLRVLTTPGSGALRAEEFSARLLWDESPQSAPLGDILRVHDWAYVRKIQAVCEAIPPTPSRVGHLDGDTAVSHGTFAAALAAAGAVCSAVDRLMAGGGRNAFCAVRPPGHHAGPGGVVTSAKDPHGSHGFCLFNNVAIGAAYAMNVYRHAGVKRVAILDFDVHHGNGTEACVTGTIPSLKTYKFSTPYGEGGQTFPVYRPWLGEHDRDNIFFASVQGYGPKMPGLDVFVYPGSGATCDTRAPPANLHHTVGADPEHAQQAGDAAPAPAARPSTPPLGQGAPGEGVGSGDSAAPGAVAAASAVASPAGMEVEVGAPAAELAPAGEPPNQPAPAAAVVADEDPEHEFEYHGGEAPPREGPRIIDVGIPGPGTKAALWRRAWRDKILPALVNFGPDIIFVSAGFDAHKKDEINFHYVGITERDFEWITDQLVQVANRCCNGRLVSVLEGGYRIQGGIVSAFARSVAAHVRALAEPHSQKWDPQDAKWEREYEKRQRAEAEAKRAAAAAAAEQVAIERAAAAAAANGTVVLGAMSTGATGTDAVGPLPGFGAGGTAALPAGGAQGGIQGDGQGACASEPEPKRRRRSASVDYVALNKRLEEERAAAAAAAAANANQGPQN